MRNDEAISPDLKPCPFCGSTFLYLQNLVDADDYFVSCEDCEVQQIAKYTQAVAAERWNRRHNPADVVTLTSESDALREVLKALVNRIMTRTLLTLDGSPELEAARKLMEKSK